MVMTRKGNRTPKSDHVSERPLTQACLARPGDELAPPGPDLPAPSLPPRPSLADGLVSLKWRWFQLRRRTLFVLLAVTAVPCGWLTWKSEYKRKEREVISQIERLGGHVFFEPKGCEQREPPGVPWVRELLGEDFFANIATVWLGERTTDADLAHLNSLKGFDFLVLVAPRLQGDDVYLGNAALTDAGIAHLKRLKRLKRLRVGDACMSDAGIAELQKALPHCEVFR
jgi:hypothetical protein